MSLQTWIDEFCPVGAAELVESGASDIELTEHAIRKWSGRLPQNLKKHGVIAYGRVVVEEGSLHAGFEFDGETCALCVRYFNPQINSHDGCPLYDHLGYACDSIEGVDQALYHVALMDGPEVMIDALQAALEGLRK